VRRFFTAVTVPLAPVSVREVDQWLERPPQHHRAWATINRRLQALKPLFDVGVDQPLVAGHPVTPSHVVRRGRPLPTALSREPVPRRLAHLDHPMDRALVLGMLRGGRRVSEVAALKRAPLDGEQQARLIEPGKGRQDRRVSLAPDAVASLHQCRAQPPGDQTTGEVWWHRHRHQPPLSVTAIPQQMARDAKAAGIPASGQSWRQTGASNWLAHGAEVVVIRDFLGPRQSASTER
jgi:integrase